MARGLSDLQKNILHVVNDRPGGDYLTRINGVIKQRLFSGDIPEVFAWKKGKGYCKYINGEFIEDMTAFIHQQKRANQIRVTISKSISGLVKRGLLTKTMQRGKEYRNTWIDIAGTGKLLVNEEFNQAKEILSIDP